MNENRSCKSSSQSIAKVHFFLDITKVYYLNALQIGQKCRGKYHKQELPNILTYHSTFEVNVMGGCIIHKIVGNDEYLVHLYTEMELTLNQRHLLVRRGQEII